MPNSRKFINSDEDIYCQQEVIEIFSSRFKVIIVTLTILLFFFLPLFLRLQTQGLFMWIFVGLIITLSVLLKKTKKVHYLLTSQRVLKLGFDKSVVLWALKTKEITQIRVHNANIHIHIPKKTYIVYNASHHTDFLQKLIAAKKDINI